jgi:hypothetical protein
MQELRLIKQNEGVVKELVPGFASYLEIPLARRDHQIRTRLRQPGTALSVTPSFFASLKKETNRR